MIGLIRQIRAALSDDLRKPQYRGMKPASAGHCYVACEALYHLRAREVGYRPAVMRVASGTHWFLIDAYGHVIDPTADQFEGPVDYTTGRRCGFLTKGPSKRALILIGRIMNRKGTPAEPERHH